MVPCPNVFPEGGIDLAVCCRKGLMIRAEPLFLWTLLCWAISVVKWISWYETAWLRHGHAGRIPFRSDEVVLYRRRNSSEHPDTDMQMMIDEVPRRCEATEHRRTL
jgi:hypothetical protein